MGIAFFPEKYTVKDHISNTKLEKGDHYYIQTRHKDLFFPLQSYSKKTLRKNVRNVAENTNEMCSCPRASYNTPLMALIQYGRHISKKVYYGCWS